MKVPIRDLIGCWLFGWLSLMSDNIKKFLPTGQSGNWGRKMETRRPGRSRGDTNSSLPSPIPASRSTTSHSFEKVALHNMNDRRSQNHDENRGENKQ